ncbi:hypothetical protein JL107_00845 [Nakamurella flavida]|uniref:Sec-independent protein translocase protein TatB n=1 Tax=Nakamurella flavida TaxID=363630 RepID=A0A938YC72_9ACTN|nr:hypothetical protein [Nakamurella flavida]MBM9474980.1 hypothetical protein [Nakamurella flavida]MDP9776549.1 sec-independent protein translocase protein TatB [Nakamurella flavida]
MFGLSWAQIGLIVLIGLFLLGPERIPTAVQWVVDMLKKVRGMAAGAQAELRTQIGPEMEELRRQIADLQSLKEIQELRDLRDLHPKRLIGKNILGDEFSGGVKGFLGLDSQPAAASTATAEEKPVSATMPWATAAAAPAASTPPVGGPSLQKAPVDPVVQAPPPRITPQPALAPGERPPFDADGT